MSDYADHADNKIYRTIAAGLAAARCAPTLQPDFHCHFCAESVAVNLLFCNIECRDDFERFNKAPKKMGLG